MVSEKLINENNRDSVVVDCCAIIDRHVSAKSGLSGIAIKGAYKAVKAIKRGFVTNVVDALLDEWVEKLTEFEREHEAKGGQGALADYLVAEKGRVAQALVEVTDKRAESTKHKTAKKFYLRLRDKALQNVEDAVPDLAGLVTKYVDTPDAPPAAKKTGSD